MAGRRQMKCAFGNIALLKNNPNTMTEAARLRLADSIRDRPFMLNARGVVLWQVPASLPKNPNGKPSLFEGQEGRLVAIGGNQRIKALMEQGYEEIPEKWTALAKKDDGSWWTPEEAEDFVMIDNSPEGMSGENDYDILMRHFTEERMAAAGIDLANLPVENQEAFADTGGDLGEGPDGEGDEDGDPTSVQDEVEHSQHGEKDPALEEWIAKRERVRKDLPELMETGFYLCLVFETHAQKMEFVEKAGLSGDVAYEMFADGIEFARDKMGIDIERSGLHFPRMRRDQKLAELAQKNEQEPKTPTVAEVRAASLAEMAEQDRCLAWLKKIEDGEETPPKAIADRLSLYWEWLEIEREKNSAMVEACDRAERDGIHDEADMRRKEEAEALAEEATGGEDAGGEVAKAFRSAMDERASVPASEDVYNAEEDEEEPDGKEGE